MTLIVGIKCEDGIALGADGAATFTVGMGQPTIRQPVKRKLKILGSEQGVVGVSGSVGMGQRITGAIESLRNSGTLTKVKPFEAMVAIRAELWKQIELELTIARVASQVAGPNALNAAVTGTLAAVLVDGNLEPCLFQFDYQGMPDQATDDLPFVAIGSGQMIADPFLAFLRRIYWPDRLPKLQEGIFATVWTLQHAILTNAGGVGPPMQAVRFGKQSGSWKAQEIPKEECEEALQAIQAIEKELAALPAKQQTPTTSTIPPPSP